MIRYAVKDVDLRTAIAKESKNWLAKAKVNTDALRVAKRYDAGDVTENWSEIKGAFIDIQSRKCAYCERQLEEFKVEHDVEHYRPKGRVSQWPAKSSKLKYPFSLGSASQSGYYMLAFDYRNYAVACKSCNSSLKRDAFPCGGPRRLSDVDPTELAKEKPLLVFPLGEGADDPSSLIEFQGIVPVPIVKAGYDYQRARVTIDFFRLERRDHLRIERARIITAMRLALALAETGSPDAGKAADAVAIACRPGSPHTNCAICFAALWKSDKPNATALADAAQGFLKARTKRN